LNDKLYSHFDICIFKILAHYKIHNTLTIICSLIQEFEIFMQKLKEKVIRLQIIQIRPLQTSRLKISTRLVFFIFSDQPAKSNPCCPPTLYKKNLAQKM